MATYRMKINSRPDAAGLIWFCIERKGEQYAAHLARYIEVTHHFDRDKIKSDGTFCGVPLALSHVVRDVSDWVTRGDRSAARFMGADHDTDAVGPVLTFAITRPERTDVFAPGQTTEG
jgi:hypothetical protein